jgi:predicted transcriptional regulator of viral defense system
MRAKPATTPPEARVAQLAKREHGVLTASELIACGLTRAGVGRRVEIGRLHPLHRGVYAVGHAALNRRAELLAAVKACGPDAVLSHQSAAELWALAPRAPGPIHVTAPARRHPRSRPGISAHRSRTLGPRDVTRRDGIPVTKPSRTLQDLRRVLSRQQWEAAMDRATARGFSVADVVDEAREAPWSEGSCVYVTAIGSRHRR